VDRTNNPPFASLRPFPKQVSEEAIACLSSCIGPQLNLAMTRTDGRHCTCVQVAKPQAGY
jgi:hypothetical protein